MTLGIVSKLFEPPLFTWKIKGKMYTFLKTLFLNWRIIALQNFVGSCRTSVWISHWVYTYVPSTFYISSFLHRRWCRQSTYHGTVMSEDSRGRFIFLSVLVCSAQPLSRVRLFVTPWTVACQAPLSTGFFQPRILEWVAISSSRGSSQSRDLACISYVSFMAGIFSTRWAIWEASYLTLGPLDSSFISDFNIRQWIIINCILKKL